MKILLLSACLLICASLFPACNKDISEPEHKAKGCNLIYLKVDGNEEFLLDTRSKFFHKNTSSDLNKEGNIKYSEFSINNRIMSEISIGFNPMYYKKANLRGGSIRLRFDKETQILDTAFLNKRLTKFAGSAVYFNIQTDEYKSLFIDSILNYMLILFHTSCQ